MGYLSCSFRVLFYMKTTQHVMLPIFRSILHPFFDRRRTSGASRGSPTLPGRVLRAAGLPIR